MIFYTGCPRPPVTRLLPRFSRVGWSKEPLGRIGNQPQGIWIWPSWGPHPRPPWELKKGGSLFENRVYFRNFQIIIQDQKVRTIFIYFFTENSYIGLHDWEDADRFAPSKAPSRKNHENRPLRMVKQTVKETGNSGGERVDSNGIIHMSVWTSLYGNQEKIIQHLHSLITFNY